MHNHTVALARADARVADRQRSVTYSTATAPSPRHFHTLAVLGIAGLATGLITI